ncbi:hypothetical protein CLOM_g16311 [Closterium sp. NIES-68]|nr:hypothetical protein CLOM_g16311 [Closterium sp. NIES-68]GJP64260.1 hypothetical protein CLOP_g21269 [Closterium sp. NIES-67]GJP70457.1 hypothetical protein CLOP_g1401 [Closterium sp. NIES-67]
MTVVNRVVKPPGGDSTADVLNWNGDGDDVSVPDVLGSGKKCIKRLSQKNFESQVVLAHVEADTKQTGTPEPAPASDNIFTPSDQTDRPSVRLHQPAGGKSQILFGDEDYLPTKALCPQKLTDLMGTLSCEADSEEKRRPLCQAKLKDLYGSISLYGEEVVEDVRPSITVHQLPGGASSIVFGGDTPPSPPKRRPSDRKMIDLMGRGTMEPTDSGMQQLSAAKRRELQGEDIFADGKLNIRSCIGVRQPPGGGSSLSLV